MRCVTGYPSVLPDEHMLLHACASAVLCGPLKAVQQCVVHSHGRVALVEFSKPKSARVFTKQQRLVLVGNCHPIPKQFKGWEALTFPARHPGEVPKKPHGTFTDASSGDCLHLVGHCQVQCCSCLFKVERVSGIRNDDDVFSNFMRFASDACMGVLRQEQHKLVQFDAWTSS